MLRCKMIAQTYIDFFFGGKCMELSRFKNPPNTSRKQQRKQMNIGIKMNFKDMFNEVANLFTDLKVIENLSFLKMKSGH